MFPRSLSFVPMLLLPLVIGAGRAEAQSAPAANFQGGYVGAHIGGGAGSGSRANTSGMVGGIQGGYNAQSGQFVLGGEADLSFTNLSHRGGVQSYKQGTTGSVRGRVGVVVDRVMVYGTGGVAMQNNEFRDGPLKSSHSHLGAAYGLGAEVMMTQNVTLRGEFIRYDFARERYNTTTNSVNISPDMNVFRGGLNYKF